MLRLFLLHSCSPTVMLNWVTFIFSSKPAPLELFALISFNFKCTTLSAGNGTKHKVRLLFLTVGKRAYRLFSLVSHMEKHLLFSFHLKQKSLLLMVFTWVVYRGKLSVLLPLAGLELLCHSHQRHKTSDTRGASPCSSCLFSHYRKAPEMKDTGACVFWTAYPPMLQELHRSPCH